MSRTDLKGRITHCNAAFVLASGFEREELLGQANEAMSGIARGVEQVNSMNRTIASNAKQESARMHELSQAIAEIDQMTQQNAALVEQSAAAADSMNQQAEQMSGLAREFRLKH